MKDLLPALRRWQGANTAFALARVVSTWGSAPRRPGSWMAINANGEIAGSVSGGCVEGAVREEALHVLAGGPSCLLDFGIDNESAWTVGLSCGGQLQVLIQPFPESIGDELLRTIEDGGAITWHTALQDGVTTDTLERGPGPSSEPASRSAPVMHAALGAGHKITQHISRPATILIIGGADIAVHLVQLAHQLGFETILIDPRAVFTDMERFPVPPTQIHTAWPQEVLPSLALDTRTFAVLLTHDPKIDDPALSLLFDSEVAYIGALGGRNTQEKRRKRLLDQGHNQSDVDRIHGPVGLKIGAATPAEIAVSILGQIISVRNQHGLGFAR